MVPTPYENVPMSALPTLVPAIGMPQGMEWLVILVIMLLLFGHKLPNMMRGLGGSIREFKKGMNEGDEAGKTAAPPAPTVPEGAVTRGTAPEGTATRGTAPAPSISETPKS